MASDIGRESSPIERLVANLPRLGDPRRRGRAKKRLEVMPPFIKAIADRYLDKPDERVTFTDDELKSFAWFDYQCSLHDTQTSSNRQLRVLQIMRETVELFYDLKDVGLKAPLDMWRDGSHFVLSRGWRRVLIMHELHKRKLRNFSRIPVRVFKSLESFRSHLPSPAWKSGPVKGQTIHALAVAQFAKLGIKDTDKYWTHGYTHKYDFHLSHLRGSRINLLELGVSHGCSLVLWRKAFPRAKLYGVDVGATRWQRRLRRQKATQVFVGNQADAEFLTNTVIPSGPFHVIIDDASHRPEDQLASFNCLWPHVAPNGFYVIEDMHGNYWDRKAKNGPLMMDQIKEFTEQLVGADNPTKICAIHVYYNIVFIQKGAK